MNLYLIYDYKQSFPDLRGSTLTDAIIGRLMKDEGMEDFEVERSEKGKPFDAEGRVFFSVSHTRNMFGCVTGKSDVGLDIQLPGRYNIRKLAERYYTDDEKKLLADILDPADASYEAEFMRIWCRKEALVKYHGLRLADILSSESVTDRTDVRFIDLELMGGLKGCVCVRADEDDEIEGMCILSGESLNGC